MDINVKLTAEINGAKLSPKAKAIKDETLKALVTLAEGNKEFAQAIEQSGNSFADCLEHCVKGVGNSVSDITVFRKAVEFYFPGAKLNFVLNIDLGDGGFSNEAPAEAKPEGKLSLEIDNLFDF